MRSKGLLVGLTLMVTVLAGCASDDGSGEPDVDEQVFQDLDVEATDTTGVIRGVVVDAAIRPIADVNIEIPIPGGTPLTTVTSPEGAFALDGLEAGTYFVKASKAGYVETQQPVEVIAGVNTPPAVKFLLDINPSTAPYILEMVMNGFIECSFSLVAVGFAACSGVGNDHFLEEFPLDGTPKFAQGEMVWASTQSLGDQMTLAFSASKEGQTLLNDYVKETGASPLVGRANQTTLEENKVSAQLMVRAFNAPVDGTNTSDYDPDGDGCLERPQLGGCATGLGATIQQEFKVFLHMFYHFEPNDGWQFGVDGQHPVPEP